MLVPAANTNFRGRTGSSERLLPVRSIAVVPALKSSMMSGYVPAFAIRVLLASTSLIRRVGVLAAVKVAVLVGAAETGVPIDNAVMVRANAPLKVRKCGIIKWMRTE